MDKKVRDRRRAVNRERGRRRAGWVVLVVVLLAAVGLFLWLRSSDVFAVKRVTATELQHVSSEEIAEATAEAYGVSLLRLDLGDIRQKLLALPYVRSVDLHRAFPDRLELVLEEYEAVACLKVSDAGRWLLSDDGRVLEKRSDDSLLLLVSDAKTKVELGQKAPAPVVGALPITVVLADEEVAAVMPQVESVSVSPTGELTLLVEGSVEVRLGEPTELKQKLKVSGTIIQQYLRDGRSLEYVDARVPDRVAVNGE